MTTIQLDSSISNDAFNRVELLAAQVAKLDPHWSGAVIAVERGNSTCIYASEERVSLALLSRVFQAIHA